MALFKQIIIVLFILGAFAALFLVSSWTVEPPTPDIDPEALPAQDTNSLRHLDQGALLERKGDLEKALQEYEAAQEAKTKSLQQAAGQAATRVRDKIGTWYWETAYTLRDFSQLLLKVLVLATVLAAVAFLLLTLLRVLPRKSGLAIQEFKIPAKLESSLVADLRQSIANTISVVQLVHQGFQTAVRLRTEILSFPAFQPEGLDEDAFFFCPGSAGRG